MKILSIIVEVLVSPFTFLFRTKAQKNNSSNKNDSSETSKETSKKSDLDCD